MLMLHLNLVSQGKPGIKEVLGLERTRASRMRVFELLEEHKIVSKCFKKIDEKLAKAEEVSTRLEGEKYVNFYSFIFIHF